MQIKYYQHIREQVSVIAAGTQQTIDEVSKTVNIIDAQELRDRADFALVETLRTIPGFRVQQLGGFGRTANIKTRGLRNQDTAVLIDGIRFRDASAITGDASPFLSDFTLTSVSKIEVLRGSGSSLYGTNAIGGAIDFQTPKPQSGFHGQIGGAVGGLGLRRFRGNVSDGTNDGKFGFNSAFRAPFTPKELTAKTTRTIRIFNRASNTIRLKKQTFPRGFSCPTLMFGSIQVPTLSALRRVQTRRLSMPFKA